MPEKLYKQKDKVNEDIKELLLLKDSKPYKLWMDKIRGQIRKSILNILHIDLKDKNGILDLALQMKAQYDILCLVPNEEFDLEDQLEEIEKEEMRQVEKLRSGSTRSQGGF